MAVPSLCKVVNISQATITKRIDEGRRTWYPINRSLFLLILTSEYTWTGKSRRNSLTPLLQEPGVTYEVR